MGDSPHFRDCCDLRLNFDAFPKSPKQNQGGESGEGPGMLLNVRTSEPGADASDFHPDPRGSKKRVLTSPTLKNPTRKGHGHQTIR